MDHLIERVLRGAASTAERERLDAWRGADPRNEQHYRDLERVLAAAEFMRTELGAARPPTAAELLARARHPVSRDRSVAAMPARHAAEPPRARWLRNMPWAVAAAAVLLLVLNVLHTMSAPAAHVAAAEVVTGADEIVTVHLGDGSVVRLAPSSRLRLGEDGDRRTVALEGRAFFSVSRVDGHLFRVRTRAATATVLGTRFEISTEDEDLRLVVLDGRVALQAPGNRVEVGAGHMSAVSNRTAAHPTAVADAAATISWTGRFLAFHGTTLSDAAREISSAYAIPVRVTDAALGQQTVTAVFTDQSLTAVLDVLCAIVNAECNSRGNEVVISPR